MGVVGIGYVKQRSEDPALAVSPTANRVQRSGSFYDLPSLIRAAYRTANVPALNSGNQSFRLARTLLLNEFTASPLTGPDLVEK